MTKKHINQSSKINDETKRLHKRHVRRSVISIFSSIMLNNDDALFVSLYFSVKKKYHADKRYNL